MRPPIRSRRSPWPSRGHGGHVARTAGDSTPVWLPPRRSMIGRRRRIAVANASSSAVSSAPAGRCGSMPAHQSTSSTQHVPQPGHGCLVEQGGLDGRSSPAERGPQTLGSHPIHVDTERLTRSGSRLIRPRRRGSLKRIAGTTDEPANTTRRSQAGSSRPDEYCSRSIGATASTTSRPVIPKCRPMVGPSVSTSTHLAGPTRRDDRRPDHRVGEALGTDPRIDPYVRDRATDGRLDRPAPDLGFEALRHGSATGLGDAAQELFERFVELIAVDEERVVPVR